MSSGSETESYKGTPPKKAKRLCLFKKQWEQEYTWLRQPKPSECGPSTSKSSIASCAFCKICCKTFVISHGGVNDVKKHAKTNEHKTRSCTVMSNNVLSSFLKKDVLNSDEEKVIAAEVTKVYHAVKHTQSYNSLDCDVKLMPIVFPDSKIAGKITLGRTKASAVAHNVLGPHSIEKGLKFLQEGVYYSISTDASNHGSSNLFPILL